MLVCVCCVFVLQSCYVVERCCWRAEGFIALLPVRTCTRACYACSSSQTNEDNYVLVAS